MHENFSANIQEKTFPANLFDACTLLKRKDPNCGIQEKGKNVKK
jgi:hypothetical protein